jgi:hypothetical protein
MKIIALYLPQYHSIPENDEWWGKGYTEWNAVRSARPLFRGHYEPHVPLNKNYYDLSDEEAKTWLWQTDLARKNGISAFCIYHYWFGDGHQLLQKPAEILLRHTEISFPFFFCWANESWTKTWYGEANQILMQQKYSDDDVEKHFEYLLPFFMDSRYLKKDGKPIVCLYKTKMIPNIDSFIQKWDILARRHGLPGIFFVSGNTNSGVDKRPLFDARYDFEPGFTLKNDMPLSRSFRYYSRTGLTEVVNKLFHKQYLERKIPAEAIYKRIYKRCKKNLSQEGCVPTYAGFFPNWDNTPRRGYLGLAYTGTSPSLFKRYLLKMNSILQPDDFLFLDAWNEWGEGCHLEPDEKYGYAYLEIIKDLIMSPTSSRKH